MENIDESHVKMIAFGLFGDLGYRILTGPEIARADFAYQTGRGRAQIR